MHRRQFLQAAAGAGCAACAQETEAPRTYAFKTVGNCEIKADVHGAVDGVRKPVMVWIHGGALINGSRGLSRREGRVANLTNLVLKAGFVIVSIDYRLAPETKLPGIIEDVQDAFRWIRQQGPKLFGADVNRIAVSGGSAGGYLTLMTGFCVEPRPMALLSLYGYGDIVGPWYSRPDPFYNQQPAVPKEEAYSVVGGPAVSEGGGKRGRFYLYCRQNGLWPKEVAGHDPDSEAGWFRRYCPVQNVTAEYPPAFLIHGDKDTDVPYQQSVLMAKELARAGRPHEFITIPGGGHGFGNYPDPAVIASASDRAVAFVKRHVG